MQVQLPPTTEPLHEMSSVRRSNALWTCEQCWMGFLSIIPVTCNSLRLLLSKLFTKQRNPQATAEHMCAPFLAVILANWRCLQPWALRSCTLIDSSNGS
eukprot:1153140-Pelagomonas_calceolata.AAC.2